MFERVLIAVDRSAPAARAARVGGNLALRLGARVLLVHAVDSTYAYAAPAPALGAVPPVGLYDELRRDGQELLTTVSGRFPASARPEALLREGRPARAILDAAREAGADLIVIGTHSRGGIERLILGSTAEAVLREAPCPVLTVQADEAAPEMETVPTA